MTTNTVTGGTSSGLTVGNGDFLLVSSGGVVIDTMVSGGGTENVGTGGVASFTTVSGGGIENVSSGGLASGARVLVGGSQTVSSGGMAIGTVLSGGVQAVFFGGTASGTSVSANGIVAVSAGGIADFMTVSGSGEDYVFAGGQVNSTMIGANGYEILFGGLASGSVVSADGAQEVLASGAIVSATIVRGEEYVYSGGVANGLVVSADAFDEVNLNGTVDDTVVSSGGVEYVNSGGVANASMVESGGTQYVFAGGVASGSVISGGGYEVISSGEAEFSVVSRGGSIELPDILFSSGGSAIVDQNDVLSVTEGVDSYRQPLAGLYTGEAFEATKDPSGGTLLTLEASPRTLVWTGSDGNAFSAASNWDDVTDDVDPALAAPGQMDTADFLNGGGPVTGSGSVAALTFDNGGVWQLALAAKLSAAGAVVVGVSEATALQIGQGSWLPGEVATIAAGTGASGSSVDVSGSGSEWNLTGSLVAGDAGFGSLSLSQSATVAAGGLDAGAASGGDGVISVVGTGTALNLSGDLDIGDQSSGELSILSGAVVSAVNGNVGGTAGTGNVDIEGTGSALDLSGTLAIGLNSPAVFTLGEDTELTLSGSVVTGADGVFNQDGTVDPANVVNDNVTNLGNGAKTEADVSIENSGVYTLSNGTATMYTPLITYDPNPDTDGGSTNGVWQIGNVGTLVLNSTTVDASQTVEFIKNNAVLEIGQVPATNDGTITGSVAAGSPNVLAGFEAPIQNYKSGDKVILKGLSYGSDTVSGNTVMVWSGAADTGTDLGSLSFITPSGAADDTGAGLAATQIEAGAVSCFVTGTRVGTETGGKKVETLKAGDRVATVDGRYEEVVWVGSRTVDCTRHPTPESAWPVRIAKDAFGQNTPGRDLYLSPDHAVFVNGVLVPVKLLVNGTTIAQVKRRRVTYHHVELAAHEVILADGLPVESYLDAGDRANFHDEGAVRLFVDFERSTDTARLWEAKGAAPLVQAGEQLDRARAVVAAHARLCDPGARDPDLASHPRVA
jgi:autotransporter passenger strand-loop-strand repeat protein/T5SS/PEP-CTERM-associated repeat protein